MGASIPVCMGWQYWIFLRLFHNLILFFTFLGTILHNIIDYFDDEQASVINNLQSEKNYQIPKLY